MIRASYTATKESLSLYRSKQTAVPAKARTRATLIILGILGIALMACSSWTTVYSVNRFDELGWWATLILLTAGFVFVIGLIMLTLVPLLYLYRSLRSRNRSLLGTRIAFELSTDGIASSGKGFSWRHQWHDFAKAHLFPDGLILFIGEDPNMWIPKIAFTSDAHFHSAVELIRTSCPIEKDEIPLGSNSQTPQPQTEQSPPMKSTSAMHEEFYDAAVFGNVEAVTKMLNIDSSLVKATDEYGFTALHGVAGEDQLEIAELLIRNGAEVNAQNNLGITPLYLSAYPSMVELLVKNGADLNHRSDNGSTPLHTFAAEREGIDSMRALLRLGADSKITNDAGQTAAQIARQRGEQDKVDLLS